MKPNLRLAGIVSALLFSQQIFASPAQDPLKQLSTTPLPQVTGGDFDHFAVDVKQKKLYVSAEDYGSIEVFEIPSGRHLSSEKGIAVEPHKILLTHAGKQLFVADAGAASLKIVDTRSFRVNKVVPLRPGPDSGVEDERTGIFYLGNGGRKEKLDHSDITLISTRDGRVLGKIEVPAGQVKAMAIDATTNRMFVNFRDRNEIGIIDLRTRKLTDTWRIPGPSRNSAMEFDPATNRLFIGARNPGKLFVLDATNGSIVQSVDIVETSDEIINDKLHHRLYVAGSNGLDVVRQDNRDHYSIEQHVDTFGGKTAILIPSLERLFVVHTKGPASKEAGLQVFSVQ